MTTHSASIASAVGEAIHAAVIITRKKDKYQQATTAAKTLAVAAAPLQAGDVVAA